MYIRKIAAVSMALPNSGAVIWRTLKEAKELGIDFILHNNRLIPSDFDPTKDFMEIEPLPEYIIDRIMKI